MMRAALLDDGLLRLQIDLPQPARRQALAYLDLLAKWNGVYRLTAIADQDAAVARHLLDSLAILPFAAGQSLLDVGSGGGMPGIPLAIARPDLAVTLLDSSAKKAAFLRQAAIELRLTNVAVHCGRVEEYQPEARFAIITARAFASLAAMVSASRHLLQTGGCWLAMKGRWPHEEIAGLPPDTALAAVHRLCVPGIDGERHLLVITIDAPETAKGDH